MRTFNQIKFVYILLALDFLDCYPEHVFLNGTWKTFCAFDHSDNLIKSFSHEDCQEHCANIYPKCIEILYYPSNETCVACGLYLTQITGFEKKLYIRSVRKGFEMFTSVSSDATFCDINHPENLYEMPSFHECIEMCYDLGLDCKQLFFKLPTTCILCYKFVGDFNTAIPIQIRNLKFTMALRTKAKCYWSTSDKYEGNEVTDRMGNPCQYWTQSELSRYSYKSDPKNYCRSFNSTKPWCNVYFGPSECEVYPCTYEYLPY